MVTTTAATIIIIMTDKSLIQLMTLLSPVFPVGGFAYSGGLESACGGGRVRNKEDLRSWIKTSLTSGTLRNDAVLLAAAHRGNTDLQELNDLALALCGSAERYEETINLGAAFAAAARPWMQETEKPLPDPCAYAVAVGAVTAQMELKLTAVLDAFLQAAVSNQLQAALRLMSLGQQAAVALQHELEPSIQQAAESAALSQLDDLGTCAVTMELAAIQHETMTSRIFRS